MNKNLTALSIFCLAVSIVIGSWLISNSLKVSRQAVKIQTSSHLRTTLLTESELASYLGLSLYEVKELGPVSVSTGDTQSVLPYLKIGDKVYFPKVGVDKWLSNNVGSILP